MGIGDTVRKILSYVNDIPGIPREVYKKLKWRLVDIQKKLDKLDIGNIVTQVSAAVTESLGGQISVMTDGLASVLNSMQDTFERSLSNIKGVVDEIPGTIVERFEEVKAWSREMFENIFNPVKEFMGSVWSRILPWLIGILAIALFPVYGPALMGVMKAIF